TCFNKEVRIESDFRTYGSETNMEQGILDGNQQHSVAKKTYKPLIQLGLYVFFLYYSMHHFIHSYPGVGFRVLVCY
ncbi:hypothetical protein, partial [Bacillus pacificus]|uniref:hypothetical protein n=1 Tax=Bacillus pacificus TaxID=2026187 RepID=UPI001C6FC781